MLFLQQTGEIPVFERELRQFPNYCTNGVPRLCLPRIVLDVLQLFSRPNRDDPSLSLSSLSFFLFSFHFLSRQRIRKGYCRLNPVVADVVGVAVVGPFVAVHPEMSVIWTAMLGSRQ